MSKQLSKETRIALVLGLVIIVGFGVALTQLRASAPNSAGAATDFINYSLESSGDSPLPAYQRPSRSANPDAERASRQTLAERRVQPVQVSLRTETVRPNDSLTKIAKRVYGPGNVKHYRLIYEANRAILPSESKIRPGQVLVIPDLNGGRAPVMARRPDRLNGSVAYNNPRR